MRNGAYSLAFLSVLSGLALLMFAQPDGFETTLGAALLLLAPLLAGIGKVIDVIGYVGEGAAGSDEEGVR